MTANDIDTNDRDSENNGIIRNESNCHNSVVWKGIMCEGCLDF